MNKIIEHYYDNFLEYGANDERSLGWTKQKQKIRFSQLFKFLQPNNGTLLDIGCGFGDMYKYINEELEQNNIYYLGIDIMKEFIDIAVSNYPKNNSQFKCVDFLMEDESVKYDYCVASGIFGYKAYEDEKKNYEYVEKIIRKAFLMCNHGVAFNFLSDKVDYKTSELDFYASPEKILSLAYKLSRNVILDNSVMPFEFCITIFKDDSFSKETTIFHYIDT